MITDEVRARYAMFGRGRPLPPGHGTVTLEEPAEPANGAARRDRLAVVVAHIHAARSLDALFLEIKQDILELLDAEGITLYAVDRGRREIYSRFLDVDTIKEIRVPISPTSIAGYVAKTGLCVNIADAYDPRELAGINATLSFDPAWDLKTGFRTRQILAVPIMLENRQVLGVIELLNKRGGGVFTLDDLADVTELGRAAATALNGLGRQTRPKPGKFDYLRIQDLITDEELKAATADARRQQVDVETVLVTKYRIRKDDLGVALAMFYRCPFVEFTEKILIPRELLSTVRLDYLRKNFWVPLAQRGDTVEVVIDNPLDVQRVDNIKRVFEGLEVHFFVGLRGDILQFIDYASGDRTESGSVASILGEMVEEAAAEADEEQVGSEIDLNDSAVVRLANQLIVEGYKAGASDIHVEPYSGKADTVIRFRVDGSCVEYQKIPASFRRALVARFKIMSNLDIAERRKPQDGKIKFRTPDGREIELRVATLPTAGGNEDVVMRILAASEAKSLDRLGMSERNFREFREIITKPYGLVLCVGPTGSGKTTTLHSALGYINKPDRKIWTAEDPVEISQYGLRQLQVQPKIGLTFAAAMRAFLRADPDVIMIGEMRDEETAHIGIEASLTGHLVLSTLHTNSAAETVVRLLDMGCDPFNFADAVLGILAQRLLKRLCASCKEPYHPDAEEFEGLVRAYGESAFAKLDVPYDEGLTLWRGRGCESCNRSGYRGRAGIHELLVATDAIKRLVVTRAPVHELAQGALTDGMTTLLQDGIQKVLKGVTDFRQVKAVAIK